MKKLKSEKNRYSKIVLLPRSKFSRIEKLLSESILDTAIRKVYIS